MMVHFGGVALGTGSSASLSRLNFIFLTSTSNTRHALGGIRPETPCDPYPNTGGMTSRRFPPFAMPTVPSSHPLITLPLPNLNLNDLSELAFESNTCEKKNYVICSLITHQLLPSLSPPLPCQSHYFQKASQYTSHLQNLPFLLPIVKTIKGHACTKKKTTRQ